MILGQLNQHLPNVKAQECGAGDKQDIPSVAQGHPTVLRAVSIIKPSKCHKPCVSLATVKRILIDRCLVLSQLGLK